MARNMTESEIGDALDQIVRGNTSPDKSLNNFQTRNIGGGWIIEFNKKFIGGYSIRTTNGGKKRTFVTLNAVASWMNRMGIKEFKVIL